MYSDISVIELKIYWAGSSFQVLFSLYLELGCRLSSYIAISSGNTIIRRIHPSMDPNSQTEASTSSMMGPTTQRPLPRLPIEVWERAIGWLVAYAVAAGSTGLSEMSIRHDLSACALVCRAWRPRAQFHLFKYPRITGDGLSVYEKLISKSPRALFLQSIRRRRGDG